MLNRSTLDRMLTLNRALDEAFTTSMNGEAARVWVPAIDLIEKKDSYVVRAELPGRAQAQLADGLGPIGVGAARHLEVVLAGAAEHRLGLGCGIGEREAFGPEPGRLLVGGLGIPAIVRPSPLADP